MLALSMIQMRGRQVRMIPPPRKRRLDVCPDTPSGGQMVGRVWACTAGPYQAQIGFSSMFDVDSP